MCTYAYTLRLKAREQLLGDLIAANPLIHTLKSSPGELSQVEGVKSLAAVSKGVG